MKYTLLFPLILIATLFHVAVAGGAAVQATQPVWYQKSAENIIMDRLKRYGGAGAYGFDRLRGVPLRHSIIGFYDVPYFAKKIRIAVTASVPTQRYECHVCAPKISFFLFETQGNNWVFVRALINQHAMGTWGKAPDKNRYHVVHIGKNEYGLLLKVGDVGQGYWEGYIKVYHFGQTSIHKIADVQIEGNDGATGRPSKDDWKSTYHFQPSEKPFYDLIVHTTGRKDNRPIDQTTTYTYNGTAYAATPGTHTSPPHSHTQAQKTISALAERCGNNLGHFVVKLNRENFSFQYKGAGEGMGLSFTPSHFESLHMYDSMTQCDRDGDTIIHCPALENAKLHYQYDGNEYNVTVKYTDNGIARKTWLYNDKDFLYWVEYKNGKIFSFEKFPIEKRQ